MVNGEKKILIVGAHPDDAEYGAGGFLQMFGKALICVVFPMGRADEARAGADELGADCAVMDFDAENARERALIENLDEIIGRFKPNVICTHSLTGVHQDHRLVARSVISACRAFTGMVLFFGTPSDHPFAANLFVELTDAQFEKKLTALRKHKSQANRPYMQSQALHTHFNYWNEAYQGKSGRWVEPFVLHRNVIRRTG